MTMEFWTTVGVLWVLMIVLIWAFFRGVHRLNGDDLSDAEAADIARRLKNGERFIRVDETAHVVGMRERRGDEQLS